MLFLGNLTGLTGFVVILGWWMSCFLIGWLKTKESIHCLVHVVEGISANSPVLPWVAGSFCVTLVFGSCLCGLEELKRKKPWGKGRGREREGKSAPSPLTPCPNVFRFDLGLAFARLHLLRYFANHKKPPATQVAPVALNHCLVT